LALTKDPADKTAVIESLKGNSITPDIDFKNLRVRVYAIRRWWSAMSISHRNTVGAAGVKKLNVLHVLVKGPDGWQNAGAAK
jgi:hypothetical protein